MAGRRPKPTALRELQGGGGHRPHPKDEWKPEAGAPEMPRGLRKAARRAWVHWCAILVPPGILTKADGPALAIACDAFADWEEAQKDLLKTGLVLDTPVLDKENKPIMYEGRILMVRKENPAFNVKTKAVNTLKKFIIEFGLTPASRPKIHGEKEKPSDPLTDALNWMPDTDSTPMEPSLANN